jgi:hypothetical protein
MALLYRWARRVLKSQKRRFSARAAGKAVRGRQAAGFRRLHAPARIMEQAGAELADDGAHRLSEAECGERQLGSVFAVIRRAIRGRRTLYGQSIDALARPRSAPVGSISCLLRGAESSGLC